MTMDTTTSSTARDTFMYLLVVVVLAMSTISMGALTFDLINKYLPDAASFACSYDGCAGSVRIEISFLLVSFAVLVWAWRFISRDVKAHAEKAHLKVRKWLLYFTLFVAGGVLIGDLISLLNSWLAGELTFPFLLKVLAVLLIAGATFYYFLRGLHPEKPGKQSVVAWVSISAVVVALVFGFVAIGSPGAARDARLDSQRVNDLALLQGQIINYWQAKGALPQSLDELQDPISGFIIPTDPQTQMSYEYSRTGAHQFVLCATFNAESLPAGSSTLSPSRYNMPMMPAGEGTWDHIAGRVCFDRFVDTDLYPPKGALPVPAVKQ